ncbi:MAG: efflux RND transporter periplasmic adaptor subunit [Patescibacteria group bacterium]
MLKIFKKKSFWIILVVVLAVVGFIALNLLTAKPATEYTIEPVRRGRLVQTVSATGVVESANEIKLNFKTPGKIVALPVKQGQDVKAGDLLARLDSGSINAQISQYVANVASAQANLEKVKAGASIEDIQLTQEQLAKAQTDSSRLQTESAAQLKIYREKAIDSLNNSIFVGQIALNSIYNNLINNETTVNLLVSDSNLQNNVENSYGEMKAGFGDLRLQVETAKLNNGDQSKIIAASDAVRVYLNDLNGLLDNSYGLADKIINNTTYTTTVKDAIKTDFSTQQSAVNTALTASQTASSNLINNANSYQTQIEAAENSVAIAQAQLNLKQAGPRDFDLAAAQAQVAQAQASLDKARAEAADYAIKAPIDGKITKVNYSIGENSSQSEPVVTMLGNERYEIKVDIPESDITKIKVGDGVSIELDAFGSDHLFSGAVTFIDPAQTSIKDVTYYKTTVAFNQDSWNDQIKPGMTANITISAAAKDDVLYIPQRAVKIRATTLGEVPAKYVEVLVDGQPREQDIEIGLRGDNGLVEIVSGLTEGESVVTFKKDNTVK